MAKKKEMFAAWLGLMVGLMLFGGADRTAYAEDDYLHQLRGGIASVLKPVQANPAEVVETTAKQLNIELSGSYGQESKLVMANVVSALNVRSEATADSKRVGMLYKDCGGTILERKDGWTRLQSGNMVGWASDEYLLFGDEAKALADRVGKTIATINTETLRVRTAPDRGAEVMGFLPMGEIVEVLRKESEDWICVDYEGADGYVRAEFVDLDFILATGETEAEIEAREKAEMEAKRFVNYGEFTVDEDTMMLLAALIHCEAQGESYEGQVAVGAVVMNRVRSKAYPNSIRGVIYAPGQFTPAMTGKLDQVLSSGNVKESCIKAAKEVLSGYSNVADRLYFRRNNGQDGLVIGNHVFF